MEESYQPRLPPEPPKGDAWWRGRGARFWITVSAVALLVVFIVQNTEEVEVSFLFSDTEIPLIFALLLAGLLGAVIGWAAPKIRRRRGD